MHNIEELEQNDIQSNVDYMTKSHLRNVMQLAIFTSSSGVLYAINISKIQSFLIRADYELLSSPTKNEFIKGMLNIRGEVISVIDFDRWISENDDNFDKKIIIACDYNQRKIGILVGDIVSIVEKSSEELIVPSTKDEKISYITEVKPNEDEKEQMCIVFDAEKLLYDANIGDFDSKSTIYDISAFSEVEAAPYELNINNNKLVLVAEDSKIVIEKLREFLKKIGVNFEIYENGQELIDRVKSLDVNDIGMVITDIEMPIKNGYQVIKYIKQDSSYINVPVISLTSMTNQGVQDKVMQLGAIDLVNKSDLKTLHRYIHKILQGELS